MGKWRPYFSYRRKRGHSTLRLGIWRKRYDRFCHEYRFIEVSTHG